MSISSFPLAYVPSPFVAFGLLLSVLSSDLIVKVRSQDNWNVLYEDVGIDGYKLTMEWDHNPTLSLVINSGVKNPGSSVVESKCTITDSSAPKAPTDGLPYWYPRFYPKPVPDEVTKKTGVYFASVDWQPCGHKDVTICHAESHYDFHLYYEPLETMQNLKCINPSPTCKPIGLGTTWMEASYDSTAVSDNANAKFFRLMKGNIPVQYNNGGYVRGLNFCVDQSSAMPESGIHYGDKADTMQEWKQPVTIIGSHDCKLTFFEPMISWKWIRGGIYGSVGQTWPKWESGEISYDEKNFQPLPTSWSVEVSDTCRTVPDGNNCHIKIVVNGKRCNGVTGCGEPPRQCGTQKDCSSNKIVGILPVENTTVLASTSAATSSSISTTVLPTTVTSSSSPTSASTSGMNLQESITSTSSMQESSQQSTSGMNLQGSITSTSSVQESTSSTSTTQQYTQSSSTTLQASTTQQGTAFHYESLNFTKLLQHDSFAVVISGSRDMSMILQEEYSISDVYLAIGRPLQFALMKYLGLSSTDGVVALTGMTYVEENNPRSLQDSGTQEVEHKTQLNSDLNTPKHTTSRYEQHRRLQIVKILRFSYEIGLTSDAVSSGISDVQVVEDLKFEDDATRGAAFRGLFVQEMQRAQVASPGVTATQVVLNGINAGQIIDGFEIVVDERNATLPNASNHTSQIGSTTSSDYASQTSSTTSSDYAPQKSSTTSSDYTSQNSSTTSGVLQTNFTSSTEDSVVASSAAPFLIDILVIGIIRVTFS